MSEISIIGLDLAKQVFQVHAADAAGRCILRKQLKWHEVLRFFGKLVPCTVAMEACGTAHYWAREIGKLGHKTQLVPPAYVKPYVKRGKNDAIDAEAICEAASRPTMRFVPVKTMENQAIATLHRSRDLLIKNRTMQVNALRAHLAEFGIFSGALPHDALLERTVAGKGIGKLPDLIKIVCEAPAEALPDMVRATLSGFLDTIAAIGSQLDAIEKRLRAWHKSDDRSKRLDSVPGIGLVVATACRALVPDPSLFRNGRHFAAWIGVTPKLDGTGGKTRLGRISKAGNRYLRRLFVLGATSLLKSLANKTTPLALWMQGLLARRSKRAVTVALANKLARIAWAVMVRDEAYRPLVAAKLPAPAGCA